MSVRTVRLHCIRIDKQHPSGIISVDVSEHDLISKVQELVFPETDWKDGDAKKLPLYKPLFRIPIDDEGKFEKGFKDFTKLQRLTPSRTVRHYMISDSQKEEDQIDIIVGGV